MLGFPFCFKECGVALAIALLLLVWGVSALSLQMMLLCGQASGKRTYEAVAKYAGFGVG